MDLWEQDALDLVAPASLKIEGSEGEMRFIAVRAWLDIRFTASPGGPAAEFSWEGVDEGDEPGRGRIEPGTAGRIFSHMGAAPASSVSHGELFSSL